MKERPIIFSGPMVRAIPEGRKTQTRRVIAWSNSYVDGQITKFWREHWHELDFSQAWSDDGPSPAGNQGPYLHVPFPSEGTVHRVYPRYQVGDLLWVRETWSPWADKSTEVLFALGKEKAIYRADFIDGVSSLEVGGDEHWHSSIHMPKKYARLWIPITNVRVERVQEISIEDCKAEGVLCDCLENEDNRCLLGNKGHFKILWDSLNAKRGYPWESNPWVWIVEFERVK